MPPVDVPAGGTVSVRNPPVATLANHAPTVPSGVARTHASRVVLTAGQPAVAGSEMATGLLHLPSQGFVNQLATADPSAW